MKDVPNRTSAAVRPARREEERESDMKRELN